MAFQRQHGFRASGEIDHDTFAVLGRGQSETTGKALPRTGPPINARGDNPQSSSRRNNASPNASENSNRSGVGEPSTTGQSSGNLNGREGNPSPARTDQRRNENPR
jgi:hypothetical protein